MFNQRNFLHFGGAMLISLLLLGCGKEESAPVSSQVVAKVGGSEVSVHQLNSVLAKQKPTSPEAAERAKTQALKKLVDQQLAYNQSVASGLDRTPEVVMAIENAKREIIARAYFEQVVAGLSMPTADEIQKYYDDNPALFAERKVYSLQEIAVEPREEIRDALAKQVAAASDLDQVGKWLQDNDIVFRANAANRSAEQIGLTLLEKVAGMSDGEILMLEGPRNYLVVRLAASKPAPVTKETAQVRIARFLHNMKVQEVVAEEIERLKRSAQIEYLGEFAALANAAVGDTAGESLSLAGEDNAELNDSSLQKGLQGLN